MKHKTALEVLKRNAPLYTGKHILKHGNINNKPIFIERLDLVPIEIADSDEVGYWIACFYKDEEGIEKFVHLSDIVAMYNVVEFVPSE
jgi:hypothetical protein